MRRKRTLRLESAIPTLEVGGCRKVHLALERSTVGTMNTNAVKNRQGFLRLRQQGRLIKFFLVMDFLEGTNASAPRRVLTMRSSQLGTRKHAATIAGRRKQ